MRIEIATWRGMLTSFHIKWPWTEPALPEDKQHTLADIATTAFSILLMGTGVFCLIFFARRNLKLGRGDIRGARRVAIAFFVLFAIGWAGRAHVIPDFELFGYGFVELSVGLSLACIVWLLYVALEPAVRSRWPHSLITWNRVLAGNVMDARVGSHVLVGIVIGVSMLHLFNWRHYWLMQRGGAPDTPDLTVLSDYRVLFATAAMTIFMAIMSGGIIFFLLCGVRALVRKDWLAAVVAGVVMILQEGGVRNSSNLAVDLPLFMGIYLTIAFALLRMGMVAAMTALITINTLGRVPVGADPGAWYVPVAVLQISGIALLAVYAFWRSQSPSPRAISRLTATSGN